MYSREEWALLTPEQRGPCVETANARSPHGYGRCGVKRFGRTIRLTHVLAWIDANGTLPPPETPWILHHCDNPPCHRVNHLYAGTHADNHADMITKNRGSNQKKTCCSKCGGKYTMTPSGWRYCKPCAVESTRNSRRSQAATDPKYRERRAEAARRRRATNNQTINMLRNELAEAVTRIDELQRELDKVRAVKRSTRT